MTFHGYAGSILYVDLTSKTIKKEKLGEELIRNYIGNLGINTKLAYDLIKPGTNPLSPENRIILGTGPLGGTVAPACSRSNANYKSPLTHLFGSANAGDSIALMLKFAGYDHLVISGKAQGPVYLKIDDDNVEILDATHLWGKDVFETTDSLWAELGDNWVNCIGPAGENQVRFAASVTTSIPFTVGQGLAQSWGPRTSKRLRPRVLRV